MRGMGFLKGHAVLDQLLPHLALACPMGHGGDGTDIFLADRIAVLDGTGQSGRCSTFFSQPHRQPLLFDAKYPLTKWAIVTIFIL